MTTSATPRLRTFAWGVLAYNLLVMAWGAYVRASGSGAGCGRHWPLCNGQVVPREPSVATLVEVSHRVTSGLALVVVVWLMVWVLLRVPRGERARKAAVWSTVFIFGEAIVGAGLVLFELVAHDASMKRGLSMVLHLGNTFLLLAALAITAWSLGPAPPRAMRDPSRLGSIAVKVVLAASLVGVLFLASSGAIAALGDTLFPARSLREGIAQDLSPVAHVFLRLRVLHPLIAVVMGAVVVTTASVTRLLVHAPRVRVLSRVLTVAFVLQFCAGLLNVTLLAPVPMQLVHLLLADAVWIVLVLLATEALTVRRTHAIAEATDEARPLEAAL